uniref:Putative GH57: related to a-amylase n=1 Tax=Magnetococcus massalia (strain MO-1) TaxID=451514 RepID=A0A1S7LD30_MAGMO|nr:putative GH57 : related to a-amylase [Candidatus Magnetococcus massalia]
MAIGSLSLLLHAHLPYIRHPELNHAIEEDWLFEAISNCYLPLIEMLERLQADGIRTPICLSISPTLASMLGDSLLQGRYFSYLERQLVLAESLLGSQSTLDREAKSRLRWYSKRIEQTLNGYQQRQGNLLGALKTLADSGAVELITTAATHPLLPLLQGHPEAISQQLKVAAASHRDTFGQEPTGFWLPECGYDPALRPMLAAAGFEYTVLDASALQEEPEKLHSAVELGEGLVAFTRHDELSKLVWDSQTGYPGHPSYREFHLDLCHQLTLEQLSPFLPYSEVATPTGFKLHAVSQKGQAKAYYDLQAAQAQVAQDAEHFITQLVDQLGREGFNQPTGQAPLFLLPFDAELFGHWWFEGIDWLESVLRQLGSMGRMISCTTPSAHLEQQPPRSITQASPSTWGVHGDNSTWLNPQTAWIYPLLDQALSRLSTLQAQLNDPTPLEQRLFDHAQRCSMLAQASDWPFLIHHRVHAPYAEGRVKSYLARLHHLLDQWEAGEIVERELEILESLDPIFPHMA